jgi:hypothetical protein
LGERILGQTLLRPDAAHVRRELGERVGHGRDCSASKGRVPGLMDPGPLCRRT